MAPHGLSRPPLPQDLNPRGPAVPHHRWLTEGDRLSGALYLALKTPEGQYISPSTGRLTLTQSEGKEIVAQQAARRAGMPVLPGSGIKGAVRTLFELLSFSCDLFAATDRSRSYQGGEVCTPDSCCDACSLFGFPGWTGRVSFCDAAPAEPGLADVTVQKVPIPHLPHAEKTQGDFRLYDLEEARMPGPDRRTSTKRPKELAREVFTGCFTTTMTFVNTTPQELGRLLLAMGLGPDLSTQFFLRLGGVKYDGKGAAKVSPLGITLCAPRRKRLSAEEARPVCQKWITTAQASEWGLTFRPTLEQLADALQKID